jgi:hypothetical protein
MAGMVCYAYHRLYLQAFYCLGCCCCVNANFMDIYHLTRRCSPAVFPHVMALWCLPIGADTWRNCCV